MDTIVGSALASGDASSAAGALLGQLGAQLAGAAPKLVLAFASTSQPLSELTPALRRGLPGATVIACSTAGEFTERGDAKGSVSAFALAGDYEVRVGMSTGLKADLEGAVGRAAAALPASLPGFTHRTVIMLLDTLSGNAEEATLVASMLLGESTPLVGGAPGDDLQMKRGDIAWNDTVAPDAVLLAALYSKKPLGIGVQHGHRPLSKPLQVTRAEGNVIHEVDGKPARQVWLDETSAMAREQGLDPRDMDDPSKATPYLFRYEAGLTVDEGALKIRAPLSMGDNGSMNFACGMPEGVEFRITCSDPAAQVASARAAAKQAVAGLQGAPCAGAVVFDCICRYVLLGDRFKEAVAAIHEELGGARFAGFESYGEVARAGTALSGFHNTTSVVLCFPR